MTLQIAEDTFKLDKIDRLQVAIVRLGQLEFRSRSRFNGMEKFERLNERTERGAR